MHLVFYFSVDYINYLPRDVGKEKGARKRDSVFLCLDVKHMLTAASICLDGLLCLYCGNVDVFELKPLHRGSQWS